MFVSHSDVEKVRTNLTGKDLRKQQKQQLRQCLLDMIVDVLHIVDAPSCAFFWCRTPGAADPGTLPNPASGSWLKQKHLASYACWTASLSSRAPERTLDLISRRKVRTFGSLTCPNCTFQKLQKATSYNRNAGAHLDDQCIGSVEHLACINRLRRGTRLLVRSFPALINLITSLT